MIDYHRAFATGLVLLASRNNNSPTLAAASVDPTGHQIFADELTAILFTNDNECSSALGVSMAFSLIYPGCTGAGIDEVRDTLRYPSGSNMQLMWEETTQSMIGKSSGECLYEYDGVCESHAPLLQIANSVWLGDGDTLSQDYETVVGSYAKQIDFEAADSPVIVNEWVSNSTNGLIDSIVDSSKPLFPPYVLIAINSIYLKASWAEQFEKSKTNLDTFYAFASRNTQVSNAHFMNMVEKFQYSHDALPGYQVIDLPFAQSQMSMIFVLPMSDNSESVQSRELLPALADLQLTRVALSVPKFKFESKYDDSLKEGLIQMGIEAPFTEGSKALCGLFEDGYPCEQLVISKVVQKTIMDVNEEGVEAAAVTMIGVSLTSTGPSGDPIIMVLDHPFQFFIYDKSEDLVLFEGRLGAPEVPETDPEVALLDAVHSDSDFWSNAFYVNPEEPKVQVTSTSSTAIINSDPSVATTTSSTTTSTAPDSSSPPDSNKGTDDSSGKTLSSKLWTSFFLFFSLVFVW